MRVKEFITTYAAGMPETVTVFFLSRQLDELPIEVVKSKPEAKVEIAKIDPEEQTLKIYTDIDS